MARGGATVTGGGIADKFSAWSKELRERLERATEQNAAGLVGEIKKGILDGAPGGHPFKKLHPFTLAQRAGGDEDAKRLLDHGDLVGSITYTLTDDKLSARVGVLRNATQDGESINNIAQIQTGGRVIDVTPKMRAWLHAHGLHLRPETFVIVIPPAPFIAPAYRSYLEKMKARYRAAVQGK